MTNAVTTTEKKPITLRERIDNAGPEFKKALPGHISVDKFVRTVQTAITMQPAIAEAANSRDGLQSLMTACTKAATDGLILDGREAALVTFKGVIQYMPMVAGLMKKARNSGDVASIVAEIVYENDHFKYNPALDRVPDHQPDWFGVRGKPMGVYAVCYLKDQEAKPVVEVMPKSHVMNIASQSRNAAQYNPDSGKNYGEWWRKTVIRRISKYLPSSSDKDEFMQAVSRVDEDFDYTDAPTEAAPNPPVKRRGAGAAALKDVTPEPMREPEPETPHDPMTGEILDGEAQQPGDDI